MCQIMTQKFQVIVHIGNIIQKGFDFMDLSLNEILTIKRALIVYNKSLIYGLRNKGYFIDSFTVKEDINNIISINRKIRESL